MGGFHLHTIGRSLKKNSPSQKHYVYMLRCKDHSLYTGWTTNLEDRVATHNSGKGAKYTRSRRPVTLVYYEEFEDKIEAQRRERAIKKLSRCEKLALVGSAYRIAPESAIDK